MIIADTNLGPMNDYLDYAPDSRPYVQVILE